jgi:hypothetical protein
MTDNPKLVSPNPNVHASASKTRYKLLGPKDVMNMQDPKWLIEGILPEGSISFLTGIPGTGKSFLGLDWTLSISSGAAWGERAVQEGPVVYIYSEDIGGLKHRLAAWAAVKGFSPLHAHFVGEPVKIGGDDKNEHALAESIRSVVPENPKLIVVDTLIRCFGGGSENDSSDMQAFIDGLDFLRRKFDNCAILVIHHPSKANNGNKPRGSSALEGAADTTFEFDKTKLSCTKQKSGKRFDPIPISQEVITLQDGNTSLVLNIGKHQVANDNCPGELEITPAQNLGDVMVSVLANADEKGLKHGEWRAASIKAGVSKTSFANHLKKLKKSGKVHCIDGLYQIHVPEKTKP